MTSESPPPECAFMVGYPPKRCGMPSDAVVHNSQHGLGHVFVPPPELPPPDFYCDVCSFLWSEHTEDGRKMHTPPESPPPAFTSFGGPCKQCGFPRYDLIQHGSAGHSFETSLPAPQSVAQARARLWEAIDLHATPPARPSICEVCSRNLADYKQAIEATAAEGAEDVIRALQTEVTFAAAAVEGLEVVAYEAATVLRIHDSRPGTTDAGPSHAFERLRRALAALASPPKARP